MLRFTCASTILLMALTLPVGAESRYRGFAEAGATVSANPPVGDPPGFGVGLGIECGVHEHVWILALGEFNHLKEDAVSPIDNVKSYSFYGGMVGVRVRALDAADRTRPCFDLGFGFQTWQEPEYFSSGTSTSYRIERRTEPSLGMGLGIQFQLAGATMYAGIRGSVILTPNGQSSLIPLRIGVMFP